MNAPSGSPEAIPLALISTSGCTPACSMAHIRPVRPMPDCTSSATSRIPYLSHSARSRASQEAGGTMYPPSPCTGSTKIAATSDGATWYLNSTSSR